MNTLLNDSLLALVFVIIAFWVFVSILLIMYFGTTKIFETSFIPPRSPAEATEARRLSNEREDSEKKKILNDLKNVKISPVETTRTQRDSHQKIWEMVELGIAVNQTLTQEDSDGELQGDHWISYYRWLWLALYQLLFGSPITIVMTIFGLDPLTNATVGLAATIPLLVIFCAITVGEKERVALSRFGAHVSFLGPGLHLYVPLVETYRSIPLSNMVWGPGGSTEAESANTAEFHINGTTKDGTNPEPGVIKVTLLGTYELEVTVKITLRVRRSSMLDWYRWMYEFTNLTEVGEAIADTVKAVITTRTREIFVKEGEKEKELKEEIEKRLRNFVDTIPEISGEILQALYEMTRARLAGILPMSVAITNVTPSKTFRDLLVRLDTAKIEQEVQKLAGKGTADRNIEVFQGILKLMSKEGGGHELDTILQVMRQDAQNTVARQGSAVDQLLTTLLLPLLEKMSPVTKPGNEKPSK